MATPSPKEQLDYIQKIIIDKAGRFQGVIINNKPVPIPEVAGLFGINSEALQLELIDLKNKVPVIKRRTL